MCGIAGKLNFDSASRTERPEIDSMLGPITHRGPDGQGIYLDGPVGLGHCRLSVIDLSTGAQPMANEDETVWIVFNGEIYNFRELRVRLLAKGHIFRSFSDTEVILHLYEDLGPDCVRELRGMFAFALWDKRKRRLFLARDRVGIKPLYYSQTKEGFLFASELKSILTAPSLARDLNPSAIRTFLAFNYLPGEATLFSAIRKLLPGHSLTIEDGVVRVAKYWDLEFSESRRFESFDAACGELQSLLASTVRDHMIADVPVGVLLSGGVDSSAILAFAVESAGPKIQTFTVGFDGEGVVDERPYAKLMAQRFGTEHHETTVAAQDFWDFLPDYVRHMEEPVCEPPALALHHVTKLARQRGVKVLLSGEGGDEAFAGYPNYPNMMRLQRWESALGPLARAGGAVAAGVGRLIGNGRLARYGEALGRRLSSHYFSRTSGPTAFFISASATFFRPEFLRATASVSPSGIVQNLVDVVSDQPLLNQMLYIDTKTWLPDDLLVKADKMTMANSLELRVPLLDHRVLEFAATLPAEFKVRGNETKRILKTAFSRVLPPEVLNRRKAGFPVPYAKWLRDDFKDPVADILLSDRAVSRGYFNKHAIVSLLKANENSGRFAKEVFSLVVLELWHREFADPSSN